MRYKGQHHSIKIPLAETDDAGKLRARFDQEYERRYGHANSAAEVELVVLHSLATLHMNRPDVARLARPVSGRASGGAGDAADLLPRRGSVPADPGV